MGLEDTLNDLIIGGADVVDKMNLNDLMTSLGFLSGGKLLDIFLFMQTRGGILLGISFLFCIIMMLVSKDEHTLYSAKVFLPKLIGRALVLALIIPITVIVLDGADAFANYFLGAKSLLDSVTGAITDNPVLTGAVLSVFNVGLLLLLAVVMLLIIFVRIIDIVFVIVFILAFIIFPFFIGLSLIERWEQAYKNLITLMIVTIIVVPIKNLVLTIGFELLANNFSLELLLGVVTAILMLYLVIITGLLITTFNRIFVHN
jgi:hypothetical protein